MAEYKTTIALEIGAQSVVMAVFTPSGKGFALSRYARKDILLDPVEEGLRIEYVSSAIADLVKELKVRGRDVRNIVSGQKVFMRFIKLPALDNMDDLAEQVGYEAQQHIPFAPEDIIYSYQALEGADEGEQEVLLVAIKKDELDDLNSQVEGNGLKTSSVDCSITSLYNAFRANYPEVEEPVMLLDIGAKTTDIIFSEAGRFFTRSVTAAGSFVTNSIAREFNVSFREAEQIKIEQGVVSLGNGHTDTMSEADASLAAVIRNAMTRLSSEVQRTINHYRAQYKGSAPVKVYICGGGARLAYVSEFLESSLDIPVEFFNPLRTLAQGASLDPASLDMDALCLGPVVGAAVSGAKIGEFSIDLVPTSVGKDRAEKKLIPIAVASGLVALLGAGYFASVAASRAKEAESVLRRAEAPVAHLENLHASIERSESNFKNSAKTITEWKNLNEERFAYSDIINQLSHKMADVSYWLTNFEPCVNYDVAGSGLSNKDGDKNNSVLIDVRVAPTVSGLRVPEDAAKNTPKVTAIVLSGYVFKKSAGRSSMHLLGDLLQNQFSEKQPDSLFAFESQKVNNNMSHYILVQDSKASKGAMVIPDYLEKFTLLMPLKNPMTVAEFAPKGRTAAPASNDDDD